jgi:ATP-dependent RNA circularization protein (DNA/RNA ligase family)
MGPGIQGNREKLPELAFFVFDVFDIDEQKFMSGAQKFAVIEVLGLNHVPIVDEMSFTELPTGDVTALLKLAEGPSINHPVREGLVWKRLDGKFSFKTIANNFLLEEK